MTHPTQPPATYPLQQQMYSMNSMPYEGLKTLQSTMKGMLKSNSYYGSASDEGYGYMPISGSEGIGDFNFFGMGDSFDSDSMSELKKPDISSLSDLTSGGYEANYQGTEYVKEMPKKDPCDPCEKIKSEHDHDSGQNSGYYSAQPKFTDYHSAKPKYTDYYSAQPKFSDYYKSEKDYRGISREEDLNSYYGKNGPPSGIMTIISNLNKYNKRKEEEEGNVQKRKKWTTVPKFLTYTVSPETYDGSGQNAEIPHGKAKHQWKEEEEDGEEKEEEKEEEEEEEEAEEVDVQKRRRRRQKTTVPTAYTLSPETNYGSGQEATMPEGQGKAKHLSKAKQIAQMLEMLDKMKK